MSEQVPDKRLRSAPSPTFNSALSSFVGTNNFLTPQLGVAQGLRDLGDRPAAFVASELIPCLRPHRQDTHSLSLLYRATLLTSPPRSGSHRRATVGSGLPPTHTKYAAGLKAAWPALRASKATKAFASRSRLSGVFGSDSSFGPSSASALAFLFAR